MTLLHQFLRLFIFPVFCIKCSQAIRYSSPLELCLFCLTELPLTNHFELSDNLMEQRFWGRIPFHRAGALFYFQKGEYIQQIIYRMKYGNGQAMGFALGRLLGQALKESADFKSVDYLLPVPLHPKKLLERGFNQSELICTGIQQAWDKPICTDLRRIKQTKTQTQMGRVERAKNLESAFSFKSSHPKEIHYLLVDDVLTSGATIEACGEAILKVNPKARISMATLAFADLW